jgi:hypothetical protein
VRAAFVLLPWAVAVAGCGGAIATSVDAGTLGASTDAGPSADVASGGADATTESGACPQEDVRCDGVCTDTASDPQNCGVCGAKCGTGLICSGGICALVFDSGVHDSDGGVCITGFVCNGVCVDPSVDAGACDCGHGRFLCEPEGGAPFCTNPQTDPLNCGTCGYVCGSVCAPCPPQTGCMGGFCETTSCDCPPSPCPTGPAPQSGQPCSTLGICAYEAPNCRTFCTCIGYGSGQAEWSCQADCPPAACPATVPPEGTGCGPNPVTCTFAVDGGCGTVACICNAEDGWQCADCPDAGQDAEPD